MDGIHDMGGMHGFGRVPYALDDPPYHEDWERRVFGMSIGSTAPPYMNLDYNRHSLHVLDALEHLLAERGLVTKQALDSRVEEWEAAYRRTPHGQPVEI